MTRKIILIIFIFSIFYSCSKSNKINNNDIENIIENNQNEASNTQKSEIQKIMYVNSKEGLRIRDKPDISGKILDVLNHKSSVYIDEKSETKTIIDNIEECWYLVSIDNLHGWVFGGYLRNSIEEIECEEIIGLYYAGEINVIKEENINHRDGFTVLDNNMTDKNNIYFEITLIDENLLNIFYQFPFFGSPDPKRNNMKFKYLQKEGTPICRMSAERGGGGTEITFYKKGEKILLDIDYNFNPNMEEYDDYAIEIFKCEIIFNKYGL
jgi:hypothetical protein